MTFHQVIYSYLFSVSIRCLEISGGKGCNLIKEKFLALRNPEQSLLLCGDFNLSRVSWAAITQENTNVKANYMTALTE